MILIKEEDYKALDKGINASDKRNKRACLIVIKTSMFFFSQREVNPPGQTTIKFKFSFNLRFRFCFPLLNTLVRFAKNPGHT